MLHAAFSRSIEAHAAVKGIRLGVDYPGEVIFHTAESLGIESTMPVQNPSALIEQPITPPPLATREVCYVGQPIAVVVAPTVARAMDEAERVLMEYEPLPAVVDHRRAPDPETTTAHSGTNSNLVASLTSRFGDPESVFHHAPRTRTIDIDQHRGAAASLEGRADILVVNN